MKSPAMTERVAYIVFLSAVALGLGLVTVVLVAIAIALIRQHWRARSR